MPKNKQNYRLIAFSIGFFFLTFFTLNISISMGFSQELPEEEHVLNSNTKIEAFALSPDAVLIALADQLDSQFEIYSFNGTKQENLPLPQELSFYGDNSLGMNLIMILIFFFPLDLLYIGLIFPIKHAI